MGSLSSLVLLGVTALVALATLVFLLSKCFFLAKWPIGRAMMLANVAYETAFKKFGLSRWHVDVVLFPVVVAGVSLLAGPWIGVVVGTAMGLAWATVLVVDIRWRSGLLTVQHGGDASEVPLPLPRLIVIVQGPLLRRGSVCDLGVWPSGHEECLEVIVLNPSLVEPQLPAMVTTHVQGTNLQATGGREDLVCPSPGELISVPIRVRAGPAAGPGGEVEIRVQHGDFVQTRRLRVTRVVEGSKAEPRSASVRRWKGGAGAAFAWRGDQDLYDPATFQSAEGLRLALGLSRRFRVPSTLFLSGRLCLVESEHRAFCMHFGWDRRSNEVPDFIRFLRDEVTIDPMLEFPLETERKLAMEIGNHMYLHLGTHAAADPGNNWKGFSWIGDGTYPWHKGEPGDSLTEQRDNALKNSQVITDTLGVELTSWGVPGRVYDKDTPRAVEAAGLEIGTDTNASAFTNVLRLVPPHHPEGCERLVEITKKYPGDPDSAFKLAMLKYWLNKARRDGGTFLFMAHHHLLVYEGWSCYHVTEELLRYVLGDCDGDFYVATVTALGRYWRDVLSPRTRVVGTEVVDGKVVVTNSGSRDLEGLPVEIEVAGGGRFMVVADVPAGEAVTVWRSPTMDPRSGTISA